jgi:2-(1,2-epoxy-1,2-dihydrophenyl)acetyl-CoA isomerase
VSELRVERTGAVGRIILDRPDAKNALTIAMRDGIVDAVREFRADDSVRAVVLTGTGDAFCAGMDLSASTVAQAGRDDFSTRTTSEALRVGVQAYIRELWELDKPTIAVVNGVAVGPGAHLALACDFVFVGPSSKFMWSFHRWGLVADAVAAGLAYRCHDDAPALVAAGDALAQTLASGPTRSFGLSKALLNTSFETDLARSLEMEGHFQSLATTSPDLVEGMAAFKEKRDANFTGR